MTLFIFYGGQTIGKQTMKIKVARLDGSRPGIGDYLLRWILRPFDVTMLLGAVAIITILVNGKGQRLGDLAAGTAVVKLKSLVHLADTILAEQPLNATLTFPQVNLLAEQDIRTARKVLNSEVEDGMKAEHLAYKMKTVLERKMGVKSQLSGVTFIETVIRDYNSYHIRKVSQGLPPA